MREVAEMRDRVRRCRSLTGLACVVVAGVSPSHDLVDSPHDEARFEGVIASKGGTCDSPDLWACGGARRWQSRSAV